MTTVRARRAVVASALIAALLLTLAAGLASAASPDPSVIGQGDPRSEGEGPGLVGDPLLAALGVLVLGALTAGVTLVVLRLARGGRVDPRRH